MVAVFAMLFITVAMFFMAVSVRFFTVLAARCVRAFIFACALHDFFKLTSVEPNTTAFGTVINLDAMTFTNKKIYVTNWTFHKYSVASFAE